MTADPASDFDREETFSEPGRLPIESNFKLTGGMLGPRGGRCGQSSSMRSGRYQLGGCLHRSCEDQVRCVHDNRQIAIVNQ